MTAVEPGAGFHGDSPTRATTGLSERRAANAGAAAVEELARAFLRLYSVRPAAGTTGSRAMTLYLEAQDALVDDPERALGLARDGLRLLTLHLERGGGDSVLQQSGGRGNNCEKLQAFRMDEDRRERRLIYGQVHDLLEKLYEAGVCLRAGPETSAETGLETSPETNLVKAGTRDIACATTRLQISGRPLATLPASLVEELRCYEEELGELVRWDDAEARDLLREVREFVTDRLRPETGKPEGAWCMWEMAARAARRKDMGALRTALRKWVRAYVGQIRQTKTCRLTAAERARHRWEGD